MLNIRNLEQRWLQYKIKSYYPLLFSTLTILVLVSGVILYPAKNSSEKNTTITLSQVTLDTVQHQANLHVNTSPPIKIDKPVITEPKIAKIIPKTINEKPIQKTIEESFPVILEPSFSFLNTLTSNSKNSYKPTPKKSTKTISKIIPAVEIIEVAETKTEKSKIENPTKIQSKQEVPAGIKISRTKTQTEIQDIIRRFNKNKNPALGLYLARYYYKTANYLKAYNYALITNNIDANIEESWLIFTSSQIKLGKKDIAIKTLEAYIKNSDSLNAKSLLYSIKKGDFK